MNFFFSLLTALYFLVWNTFRARKLRDRLFDEKEIYFTELCNSPNATDKKSHKDDCIMLIQWVVRDKLVALDASKVL